MPNSLCLYGQLHRLREDRLAGSDAPAARQAQEPEPSTLIDTLTDTLKPNRRRERSTMMTKEFLATYNQRALNGARAYALARTPEYCTMSAEQLFAFLQLGWEPAR